ncbi:hypothetical protein DERP_010406 [Dermatophagoides pteronyssinus]|uniref:Uncharacterized protein n=1 Tax=Dermatophagoides pteronyssinus TaxID=6956 RepID=A0ABQ8J4S5_DERPT|nr:hypothetical protein DERP_010406 [Dermatophagoides pteronyssinus]
MIKQQHVDGSNRNNNIKKQQQRRLNDDRSNLNTKIFTIPYMKSSLTGNIELTNRYSNWFDI